MRIAPFTALLLGACAPQGNQSAADNLALDDLGNMAAEAPLNEVDPGTAGNAASAPTPPVWEYENSRDEMRNSTTRTARLVSENEIELGFPYGTVNGRIIIRDRAQDGLNLMFAVDEGQILCNSYSGGHLSVKFDDSPIETYSCNEASSGSSDLVFFTSERELLRRIRGARRMIIEADLYNAGPKQFRFNVAGLRWE